MPIRLHNNNLSRPVRQAPRQCDLTPVLTPNNQTIMVERASLRPVATTRSAILTQVTTNGRPNIPPNRPNVQPVQIQKEMKNETNQVPNKLRDKQTAMTAMFINPNSGPRGEFLYVITTPASKNNKDKNLLKEICFCAIRRSA